MKSPGHLPEHWLCRAIAHRCLAAIVASWAGLRKTIPRGKRGDGQNGI